MRIYFLITLVIVAYFTLLGVAFKLGKYFQKRRYRKGIKLREELDELDIRTSGTED